jgi:hypothetical protein
MNNITVSELINKALIYHHLPGNGVGGNLHIILDDGNIKNNHIQYCLEISKEKNDKLGIELCELLLKATKTQRQKLVNSYNLYA